MQVANVLRGDVVRRVALLAVARLVNAEDERLVTERLAQQLKPLARTCSTDQSAWARK